MRIRLVSLLGFFALLAWRDAGQALAQQAKGDAKDLAAIVKNAAAFVEAFHKGDAKALAGFWTPNGEYTNQSGRTARGREAIAKVFEGFFAESKGAKLRIDSDSLRFVTPDVALEGGTTAVIPADGGPPSQASYTIVHVRKDGQWYLDSVREGAYAAPTNYEHLRGLEWMVGEWVDDADKGEVARVSFDWADNRNFIVSSFETTFKNVVVGSGTQWIGWDPVAKQIRSWTFDANGGFGEGVWTQDGDKLIIKASTTLRDGKKATATNIVSRINADTVGWQSKDRTLDGKPVPDVKEVKMKRLK